MKQFILRFSVLVLVFVAQSCSRDDRRTRIAEYYLTPREIETAEMESASSAVAACRLYRYYSYVHYDPKKSTFWVRRAAELGDPVAQYNFALTIKQRGWSHEEYRKWMSLAAAQGDPDAIKSMKSTDAK